MFDDNKINWSVLQDDGINHNLETGEQEITESESFPGLRLNIKAILNDDLQMVLINLQKGLKSKKHKDFIKHSSK